MQVPHAARADQTRPDPRGRGHRLDGAADPAAAQPHAHREPKHLGYIVAWDDVTEEEQRQAEVARVTSMMESSPTNVGTAEPPRLLHDDFVRAPAYGCCQVAGR